MNIYIPNVNYTKIYNHKTQTYDTRMYDFIFINSNELPQGH